MGNSKKRDAKLSEEVKRFTTCYKLGSVKSFRAGSSALLDVWGSNAQNWEKGLRENFWADEGKILLQADQSGAEALVVAYLTKPGNFRDLFLNGIKPHIYIGLAFPHHWQKQHPYVHEIATLKIPEIKKHPNWAALKTAIADSDNNPAQTRYYYIYKQTCHSGNYGIKAPTFILNVLEKSLGAIVLTNNEGKLYLNSYHSMFPEIQDWHAQVQQQLRYDRTIRNLFGYPRIFDGVLNDKTFKEAYAQCPQSTVGCITHRAYTNLQCYIEQNNLDWDLLNNNHDSYLLQVPNDKLEIRHAATKMREFMEQDLVGPYGDKFKMRCEVQVGFNWSPYKKDLNEQGLKEYSFTE